MKLEDVKKMAAALEMFGPDGLGDGSQTVEFGQTVLDLIAVVEAVERWRHSADTNQAEILEAMDDLSL